MSWNCSFQEDYWITVKLHMPIGECQYESPSRGDGGAKIKTRNTELGSVDNERTTTSTCRSWVSSRRSRLPLYIACAVKAFSWLSRYIPAQSEHYVERMQHVMRKAGAYKRTTHTLSPSKFK